MHFFRFHDFGLKTPIHAPKMGFFGDLTPKMGAISSRTSKCTNGCRNTAAVKYHTDQVQVEVQDFRL